MASESFIGISNAHSRVKSAAVRYGWSIVSESTASTDSRYLELARGAESISLRISDHSRPGDFDVSGDPSEACVSAVIEKLASPPRFHGADEERTWHSAMKARHLWALWEIRISEAKYARSCGRPVEDSEAELARLRADAEACAPQKDFLVSGGKRRSLPVDAAWLERIAGAIDGLGN